MIGVLDCSTGVSGDKLLGALLDAGSRDGSFTADHLRALAAALAPEAEVIVEPRRSHGIVATGVRVEAARQPSHRSWAIIRELLGEADLAEEVRATALRAFAELAEAEARAHGCAVDDVHFHEVGALDSIVDVVGVCAGMHALGIETLYSTPVATGWGTVATSHGVLGVPAPATALLLEGVPVTAGPARPDGGAPGELTTPTGIALLRALGARFEPAPPMRPVRSGYGAGTRDIGHPNVCRITLGEQLDRAAALDRATVAVLETNVDHLSGEAVGVALDQLIAEGALDAWATPVTMKKGRPALLLSALVPESSAEKFASRLSELTGTLGVRVSAVERFEATREHHEVATEWGVVRVKSGAGRVRVEADDVARIARERSQPYHVVAAALDEAVRETLG